MMLSLLLKNLLSMSKGSDDRKISALISFSIYYFIAKSIEGVSIGNG